MIPNLKPLIEPLTTRFPAAWAKCKAPHDDGEFNARVCAVLHFEFGLVQVGRNGKRGDPHNLSKDVINWKGEGPNPDPVTGGMGTIIDFIASHESPAANITQFTPDPNGPGAWVKPLTLDQIDQGGVHPPPVPRPAPFPSYEELGGDAGGVAISRQLEADYRRAGRPGLDGDSGMWMQRVSYDVVTRKMPTVEKAIAKHRKDWCAALGIPVP